MAARVRVARGQEREHLLEIRLWASRGPAETPHQATAPTVSSTDPTHLSKPLTVRVGQSRQGFYPHLGPWGTRTAWPHALEARAAWVIYNKLIFPSVFWRRTKLF